MISVFQECIKRTRRKVWRIINIFDILYPEMAEVCWEKKKKNLKLVRDEINNGNIGKSNCKSSLRAGQKYGTHTQ